MNFLNMRLSVNLIKVIREVKMKKKKATFWNFEKLIAPKVIQIYWVVLMFLCFFGAIAAIAYDPKYIFSALLIVPLILLIFRLYLEVLIVIFKIYEKL